jgi:glycosyltransferase involved in cell wall biosynthesis
MKISIIIPVYNEEHTILEVLDRVKAVELEGLAKEVVVVDDGSTDGTVEKLKDEIGYENASLIKLVESSSNRGKGAAIRTGLSHVTGDIVLIQDADLEYDPQDYPRLIEPILSGRARVVFGSRFKGHIRGMKFLNWLANKVLALTANLLYRAKITDEATAYKAFDAQVIKSLDLKCQRFEFCPEVLAKVRKRGYEICEVPISYQGRSLEQGKKITYKDGFIALWTLIKYRFID